MRYVRPVRQRSSLCHHNLDGKHRWELRHDLEQPTPETVGEALEIERARGQKRVGYVCRACGCEAYD